MKIHNKRGFSLIEILAAVLIVGILVVMALPMYEKAITRSRTAEVNNLLTMVRTRQARKFAKDHEYARYFTDDALKKIAVGDSDYEVNSGAFKTVNGNYELELRDNSTVDPDTNETIVNRCVIGRYKPNGGAAQFAFAIAYDKSGLACDDKNSDPENYTKEVCSMFGTVVGDIDSVCAGTAPGMGTLCPNSCGPCQFQDPENCGCSNNTFGIRPNFVFDANNPNCYSCQYVEDDNPTENHIKVRGPQEVTNPNDVVPYVGDVTFSCRNAAATYGDTTTDPDGDDPEHPLYLHCHSIYYKTWNPEECGWVCNQKTAPSENFCKEGYEWNSSECRCQCHGACSCHETQEGENCDCINKDDNATLNLGSEGCICNGREAFGELPNDRVLDPTLTHCKCNASREPVFFGTITDSRVPEPGTHVINESNMPNAESLAQAYTADHEQNYWLAACCLHEHLWSATDLPDFDYDACCPFASYKYSDNGSATDESRHIQFNGNTEACCPADELFYHSTATSTTLHDPNAQYTSRPAGTLQAKICHKCEQWQQAWNEEDGCYLCPGKTFTTWNDSAKVSECKCPTGTDGDNTISATGENCQCTKDNTEWIDSIAYVNYGTGEGTGFVGENTWHANNGACKCINGFGDTYWGLQLASKTAALLGVVSSDDSTQFIPKQKVTGFDKIKEFKPVDGARGYCCPNAYVTGVYNDNNENVSSVVGSACCPTGKSFFHNTTYASNTCGVCQNQTDTVVNGNCQPCPAGFVPVYNTRLGYAECVCPTGTHRVVRKTAYSQSLMEKQDESCVCDLENATWQAPDGWVQHYINNFITHTEESMPSPWNENNGYCDCNPGYQFVQNGTIDTEDGVGGTDIASAYPNGYCCLDGQCHTAVGNSYTQDTKYCCDSGISFNSEENQAACCAAPAQHHYYSLSDLAEAGLTESGRAGLDAQGNAINSKATIGGCARCDDPTKDANCSPCMTWLGQVQRVPVWNNNTSDGYSTCECPAGTQEQAPGWVDRFLQILNLTTWNPGCYCQADNSVWNGEKCECESDHFTYATAEDQTSKCCPKTEPLYRSSPDGSKHECCPFATPNLWNDGQCKQCPQDRPHYYVWTNTSDDDNNGNNGNNNANWTVNEKLDERGGTTSSTSSITFVEASMLELNANCHACPESRPYQQGTTCCPNSLGEGVQGYYISSQQTCSICDEGYVLINGQCRPNTGSGTTGPCQDTNATPQWDPEQHAYVCVCSNGADYYNNAVEEYQEGTNQVVMTHCPTSGNYCPQTDGSTKCSCNICRFHNSNELPHLPTWYPGFQQCSCDAPREFNPSCCSNPAGQQCCKCPSGFVESHPNGSLSQFFLDNYGYNSGQGCCKTEHIAANYSGHGKPYCCGLDGNGNKIDASPDGCCTADKPYYDSTNNTCAKCDPTVSGVWYNTSTNRCERCLSPRIISGFNSNYGVNTQCSCPAGTSENGAGGSTTQIFTGITVNLGDVNLGSLGSNSRETNTNTNSSTSNSYPSSSLSFCKCIKAGTVWNGSKCVCENGGEDATQYASDGVTVLSCCANGETWATGNSMCCPNNRLHDNLCCPAGTTWNGSLNNCAKCAENQYWNGSSCASCPSGFTPTSWSDTVYAYTSCLCPSGTVNATTNLIPGLNTGTFRCSCPNSDEYYTSASYQSANWGTSGASCKACPTGSTWNTTQKKCVCPSPTTLGLVNGSYVCKCAGSTNHPLPIWSNNNASATCCLKNNVLPYTAISSNTTQPTKCCARAQLNVANTYNPTATDCVACPSNQIWKSNSCQDCPALQEPDTSTWNTTYYGGAYTSCKCIVGSLNGRGGVIKSGGSDTDCKCANIGEYYTNNNYVSVPYNATAGYSCKKCPAGSTWNGSACVCGNGFTMRNGACHCFNPSNPTQKGWTGFSTLTLSGCTAGSSNCVCGECPSNTYKIDYNNNNNDTSGCKCAAAFGGQCVASNMHLTYIHGNSYSQGKYNVVEYNGNRIGICLFTCPSNTSYGTGNFTNYLGCVDSGQCGYVQSNPCATLPCECDLPTDIVDIREGKCGIGGSEKPGKETGKDKIEYGGISLRP